MIIIVLVAVIIIMVSKASARYIENKKVEGQAAIAKPIIKIEYGNIQILENLTLKTNSFNFSIKNYDEHENITEVGLKYFLKIKLTQEDAPIKMDLFKINEDGSLLRLELDKKNTIDQFVFVNHEKQTDKFRLDITYDTSSKVTMNDFTDVILEVESIQI